MKKFLLIWPNKSETVEGFDIVDSFFRSGYRMNDFVNLLDWKELS
jgi:hypothetical protein